MRGEHGEQERSAAVPAPRDEDWCSDGRQTGHVAIPAVEHGVKESEADPLAETVGTLSRSRPGKTKRAGMRLARDHLECVMVAQLPPACSTMLRVSGRVLRTVRHGSERPVTRPFGRLAASLRSSGAGPRCPMVIDSHDRVRADGSGRSARPGGSVTSSGGAGTRSTKPCSGMRV